MFSTKAGNCDEELEKLADGAGAKRLWILPALEKEALLRDHLGTVLGAGAGSWIDLTIRWAAVYAATASS